MKLFLFCLCLLLNVVLRAQKVEKYFDYLWHECEARNARFYSIMVKTDSGWHRDDYYLYEKKLQMDGTYDDSLCKSANGRFYYLYSNGVIKSTGNYLHGKKAGLWVSYYPNRMMSDSTFYENGNPLGSKMAWYQDGSAKDSAFWAADGSGLEISWFENNFPSAAGRFAANRKTNGKWQYFHENGKLSALETYEKGTLIDKKYFDENGNPIDDTVSRDRPAEFKGGIEAWQKYILKGLYFPTQYKIENADRAIVLITFTVNANGDVVDTYASTPFHPAFDRIAEKVISKSPKWIPAIEHNRQISTQLTQPVYFGQE